MQGIGKDLRRPGSGWLAVAVTGLLLIPTAAQAQTREASQAMVASERDVLLEYPSPYNRDDWVLELRSLQQEQPVGGEVRGFWRRLTLYRSSLP